MNRTLRVEGADTTHPRRAPIGAFLDDLPTALYVVAHAMFLAVGVWLWLQASSHALPYAAALLLYAASQLGFFACFAKRITMKLAVLTEQMLVFGMVLLIALRAT
jgi:hypothetical protein